jgi:hypothetical protein
MQEYKQLKSLPQENKLLESLLQESMVKSQSQEIKQSLPIKLNINTFYIASIVGMFGSYFLAMTVFWRPKNELYRDLVGNIFGVTGLATQRACCASG